MKAKLPKYIKTSIQFEQYIIALRHEWIKRVYNNQSPLSDNKEVHIK